MMAASNIGIAKHINAKSTEWAVFGDDTSMDDRVQIVAEHINGVIDDFESGRCSSGTQTVQDYICTILRNAKLSAQRWVPVDVVGVHPDNRGGSGLVPVDVHDLLLQIATQGWSWAECTALASEIPPGEEGERWRAFNKELADKADGLLA